MSFLKFWNSSSSSSSSSNSTKNKGGNKQQTEKENNQPTTAKKSSSTSSATSATGPDCVFEDDAGGGGEVSGAPFKGGRHGGRNLSISRSGRHKLRGRQRSVISGEVFGGQESGAAGAAGAESKCRDSTTSRGGGSMSGGMASTSSHATAV